MSVEFVSASAGSGKTFELTTRLARELQAEGPARVRPECVVAVTFTNRAAADLVARARRKLTEAGAHEAAQALELGLLGTVDSVCARLVAEHALDLGLSPDVQIVAEGDADLAFAEGLARVLETDAARTLRQVGRRLGYDSIKDHVAIACSLARANGLDRAALALSADRSVAGLRRILPPSLADDEARALESRLRRELTRAIGRIAENGDRTKVTAEGLNDLRGLSQRLTGADGAPWHVWARLARVKLGAKSKDLLVDVLELAGRHLEHPRFAADLEAYVRGLFEVTAAAIEQYQRWKLDHRAEDYVDLETHALRLLELEPVAAELRDRLDLLLVDEFQDTSPIQLALFMRLATLSRQVVWVGDEKQAIYGFRGTDPELVHAVLTQLADASRAKTLDKSWRSRPELVRFTSALFTGALRVDGIPRERVELHAQRQADPALGPALGWWLIEAKNEGQEASALAERIRRLIAEAPLVEDPQTRRPRPLRPGDVAVLADTNDRCDALGQALAAVGVRAAVARKGLLQELEAVLLVSALDLLIDPDDSLAAAEVSRLTGFGGETPDEWLAGRMRYCAASAHDDRKSRGEKGVAFAGDPCVARLRRAAGDLVVLSPSEAVDAAIGEVSLFDRCLAWGNAPLRFANLEALRALALQYEDHCRHHLTPCTVAGFVQYMRDLSRTDGDAQAEGVGPDAVQVLTYHRAKGLEWPVVVMVGLGRHSKYDVFDRPTIEPPDGELDALHPLAGRWIRFWPWPYQKLTKDLAYDDAGAATPEHARLAALAEAESRRLLYVGMTRPRDRLVLVARMGDEGPIVTWLDELDAAAGCALLAVPTGDEPDGTTVELLHDLEGAPVHATVERLPVPETTSTATPLPERWFATRRDEALESRPTASLTGSRAAFGEGHAVAETRPPLSIGPGYAAAEGVDYALLGTALHRFLGVALVTAAPPGASATTARDEALAERLITSHGLAGTAHAASWAAVAASLRAWIAREYPGYTIHTELPLLGTFATARGPRQLVGDADLVLEGPTDLVLVDHKSYPAEADAALRERAAHHAPQLTAYAALLEAALAKKVARALIHFPVTGKLVEVVVAGSGVGEIE